ncbi:MAG: DsrE family protein [Myxococcaceae bacterium]|nr:DsrE family protein [Myxococcaceae bacterium]
MGKILNVVERAYQGTLEEQDDQALWLVHTLQKAGGEHAVLLRGPAVSYAVRGQSVGSLEIAGVKAGNPPRLDQDLEKLRAAGVDLYAVREDAAERGISREEAIAGIQWVSRSEVPRLFVEASRVFAW